MRKVRNQLQYEIAMLQRAPALGLEGKATTTYTAIWCKPIPCLQLP